ncbi:MAG: ABC transporter permease [Spirosomataceae bacterium]
MYQQLRALEAEFLKNKYSDILWVTFIAFGLAPLMGGTFILIIQDPEAMAKAGGLAAKAKAMNFEANWPSYLSLLTQAVGVGGIMVFGFVISWIFGREYSDGTAKDLLALPTSRTKILNAKFTIYLIWCLALVLSNLFIALFIGAFLKLPAPDTAVILANLTDYFITTFLTVAIGFPIAFFAIWGKGYLAPLGFVAMAVVFAQVMAATGYGAYFPWSIPGLYSGAGGEYKKLLGNGSYAILLLIGIAGYLMTVLYWKNADQTK